ncbi:MAG: LysR family transcriptional regulator [Pseudomonadota bacterium]
MMTVFVAVAEEMGFAPAARRLNMTPPTVTRAISTLEDSLGVRLFHRTTRSVNLSQTGERYLADCRRILAEVEAADQLAAGLYATPRGKVTITAPILFGRKMVAPAILGMLERHPEISVSTVFVDRIVHLVDEGVDVALRIAELPHSSLSAIKVGEVRRVLCASPSYLEQYGEPKRPCDLIDHQTIDFTAMTTGGDWYFSKDKENESFRPNSRVSSNNGDAAIAAAVAGFGIVRMLSYQVATQINSGELKLVLDKYCPPSVPVQIVHKETGLTSARVRAVVDFMVDHIRSNFGKVEVPHLE